MSCYLISGCKLKESAVGNKNAVGSRKIFERKGKTASIKPWPAASLNRGYGCNNPFRTATAASPFAATGASVFQLDILLYLIERGNPGLATVRDDCGCNLLDALASKPSDFESGNNPVELNHISPLSAKVGVFIGWTAPPIKQIQDEKLKHKYAMVLIKCVARELSSLSDPQIYEFFPQVGHHNRCSSLWRC
ncbi:hypothetical protein CICLE_v10023531mg [Citrus x clementina]|uniref:Uncharacterized protein n=1 Tax=Citrus clementina TaxID=85681 RepID=V4TYZ7_CITCL|nr:hypothetical protein CICLE_v10023531mg [Citrus x clementina]